MEEMCYQESNEMTKKTFMIHGEKPCEEKDVGRSAKFEVVNLGVDIQRNS